MPTVLMTFAHNSFFMELSFKNLSGICLFFGSLLATLTMLIHPVGGSLGDIAHMKSAFNFSHGMAIFCLPFIAFGFWGLSDVLYDLVITYYL